MGQREGDRPAEPHLGFLGDTSRLKRGSRSHSHSSWELMEWCRCGDRIPRKMMGGEGNDVWELGMGYSRDCMFPQEGCCGLGTGWRSVGGWARENSEQGVQRGQRGNPGRGPLIGCVDLNNLQVEFGKEAANSCSIPSSAEGAQELL